MSDAKTRPASDRKAQSTIRPSDGELSDTELQEVHGGTQSSGAGAGKVTFNPFSITKKIDVSSP